MSIEYLAQIKEQEERAATIIRDGQAQAKKIISSAKERAAAIVDLAHEEADASYKEALSKAEIASFDDYERTIQHAKTECHVIRESAEKRIDEAATLLANWVVRGWH